MKCNVGGTEMIARLVIGAILLIVGFSANVAVVWQTVIFVLAGIAIITGLLHYCPVNALLGINSCKVNTDHTEHHSST